RAAEADRHVVGGVERVPRAPDVAAVARRSPDAGHVIRDRVEALSQRGRAWANGQDRGSFRGVAVGAWRRYQAVDGPLQSALLSLYFLVAILPALLVMEEFLDSHPRTLADHLARHYGFSEETATLLRSVLVQSRAHELSSGLLAIAGALFFGLGFGR